VKVRCTINAMNSLPIATGAIAPPTPSVRLRTGLVFLGASVVTVALLGWGLAIATARVAGLEGERARSEGRIARVEKIIGGCPTTVADTVRVAATSGS